MDHKTLKALRKSIDKWRENSRSECVEDVLMGVHECPLCEIFYHRTREIEMLDACKGCPVMESTGKRYCNGSPYDECGNKYFEWYADNYNSKARKEYRICAEREVAFLQNLLPAGDPWREDHVRGGA